MTSIQVRTPFSWLGVLSGVTTRSSDFSFDNPQRDQQIDQLLLQEKCFPQHVRRAFMRQTHQDHIEVICTQGWKQPQKEFAETDGMVTNEPNVFLSALGADCASVLIHDEKNRAIGIAHAGWRGTQAQILKKIIQLMHARFGSQAKHLQVGIGPLIRACCYEVQKDVAQFFKHSVASRDGRLYLDLSKEIQRQLEENGVSRRLIRDSGICTMCSQRDFFSFRRMPNETRRHMAFIMLPSN